MTLRTHVPWLDRDIQDLETLYLQVPDQRLRHRLLGSAAAASAQEGSVHLLSFTGRGGRYSFRPEAVLPRLTEQLPREMREERVTIRSIDSQAAVTDRIWDRIDSDTIIADSITDLRTGRVGEEALERAARELGERTILVLDGRPPYSELADRMDCIVRLQWADGSPVKKVCKHPRRQPHSERIRLGDHQKTLEDFAEATV